MGYCSLKVRQVIMFKGEIWMLKRNLLLISVISLIFCFNMISFDPSKGGEIEVRLCGTKEKPMLKFIGKMGDLFQISFERYQVKRKDFVVEHQIEFAEPFKVRMDTNVEGCNLVGNPVEIAAAGFLSLDKSLVEPRYFLKLVSFYFEHNFIKYSIAFYLPETTYNQYSIKQVRSNVYILQRKGEINSLLLPGLEYRFGMGRDNFVEATVDDFLCTIGLEENRMISIFYKKILHFPWPYN